MKLADDSSSSAEDSKEMLSEIKNKLIDLMLERSLSELARVKLKDCISLLEAFSTSIDRNFEKDEKSTSTTLKPLQPSLPRSSEDLSLREQKMPNSRSTSALNDMKMCNNEDDVIKLKDLKLKCVEGFDEFNANRSNNELNDTSYKDLNVDGLVLNQFKTVKNLEMNNDKFKDKHQVNDQYKISTNDSLVHEVNNIKPEVMRKESNNPKPRRKRDSSTLFDISLDDLTEPNHSGFLIEKHSGKDWWCVLQDQHLCMFPSKNREELAYDVLLVPCCEISLDDAFNNSPVFRLTQVGSTPWVFSAGTERNLRAWLRALYRACGRDDADCGKHSSKKTRGKKEKRQKRNMKMFTSTIDESEEVGEDMVEEQCLQNLKENDENSLANLEGQSLNEELDELNSEDIPKPKTSPLSQISNKEMGLVNQDISFNDFVALKKQTIENVPLGKTSKIDLKCANTCDSEGNASQKDTIEFDVDGQDTLELTLFNKEIGFQPLKMIKNDNEMNTFEEKNIPVAATQINENASTSAVNKNALQKDNVESQLAKIKDNVHLSNGKVKFLLLNKEDENIEDLIRGLETKDMTLPSGSMDDDYVIMQNNSVQLHKSHLEPLSVASYETTKAFQLERKRTKKRLKLMKWVKKTISKEESDDQRMVIGDIYKVEQQDYYVKLWCLLCNGKLNGYRHVTDINPDIIIPLANCTLILGSVTSNKLFPFDIVSDGVKLVTFAAQSIKERNRWTQIVEKQRGTFLFDEVHRSYRMDNTESSTSDEDDEDHIYDEVDDISKRESDYVIPDINDSGYVSVLALESEISRRRTRKREKREDMKNIDEKDTTKAKDSLEMCKNRSPAPFPKNYTVEKNENESNHTIPLIHVEKHTYENVVKEGNKTADFDVKNNTEVEKLANYDAEQLESGNEILPFKLSASSSLPDSPPCEAHSSPNFEVGEGIGAWRPETNDKIQYLEIDLGNVMPVVAISISGRPHFDENGGEFVKSFTVHHSNDKDTWTAYKSHGKIKVFQGILSANQNCHKNFKHKITAQYFRIYPQSWHNHIAMRVSLYKDDLNNSTKKKKGDKSKFVSPIPSPMMGRKMHIKKQDISNPLQVSNNGVLPDVSEAGAHDKAKIFEIESEYAENPTAMESRIKLREQLLAKEKREQLIKLEVVKKYVDKAKEKLIILNSSAQLKPESIESEQDFLIVNLELVKVKQRLMNIETEMRELQDVREKYFSDLQDKQNSNEEKSNKAVSEQAKTNKETKPRLKRRPSKEVRVFSEDDCPDVDPDEFNHQGDLHTPSKVLENIKHFEKLTVFQPKIPS
ncbi:uncharacterized protein LOC124444469 isoform X2 [Xenia sp. Carnegie-2017]|uniref:uncharacterized protein LOC124444469 isoform X2 n=1 Tax=Xenia sp. Carnegie-2017 TaxID=2897299 RepID=UPI001F0460EA|nr:uncharacterized protein LOC124444469 isoform X2 [Xenia sp. Carnegie-2017]